jgi:hypothetical protein
VTETRGDWELARGTRSGRRERVELLIGYGLIVAVIWTPRPWQRMLYWAPVIWILGVSWFSFRGWRAMGWRGAKLVQSSWVVGVALGMSALAVLAAHRFGTLYAPDGPMAFFRTYIGYAVWSFVQQFLLVDFFLWRLMRLMPGRYAVATTAVIFAAAHLPNPVLTPMTLVWGAAACLIFLRYRNLWPLGLAHAIFGITIAMTVSGSVTHGMRVGLGYLRYRPHTGLHGGLRTNNDQRMSTEASVRAGGPVRLS